MVANDTTNDDMMAALSHAGTNGQQRHVASGATWKGNLEGSSFYKVIAFLTVRRGVAQFETISYFAVGARLVLPVLGTVVSSNPVL